MITAMESNNKTRTNIVNKTVTEFSSFFCELCEKIEIACSNYEYEIKDIFNGYTYTKKEITVILSMLKIKGYTVTCRRTINLRTDEWTTHYDLNWEVPKEKE